MPNVLLLPFTPLAPLARLAGPALAACLCPLAHAAPAWEGTVTAVVEGDVIEVTGPRGPVAVRLEGIDCPERGQDFAKIARRFTTRTALGLAVRVEEGGPGGTPRVARVVLPGGRDLSRELVRHGLAWWDREGGPGALADLEREARARYAGLWAEAEPEAPWDFRARASVPGAAEVSLAPADTLIPVIQPARYR